MSNKVMSKRVFEVLVKHLTDIEEKRVQLLDKYYPDITKEREVFEELLNAYIVKLDDTIRNAEVQESGTDICPFIIIGSIVELLNIEYDEIERYQIISPFDNCTNTDMDYASFLSPVGRALLLKEAEDSITLESPMGQCNYIVKAINIPEEMYSYIGKDG